MDEDYHGDAVGPQRRFSLRSKQRLEQIEKQIHHILRSQGPRLNSKVCKTHKIQLQKAFKNCYFYIKNSKKSQETAYKMKFDMANFPKENTKFLTVSMQKISDASSKKTHKEQSSKKGFIYCFYPQVSEQKPPQPIGINVVEISETQERFYQCVFPEKIPFNFSMLYLQRLALLSKTLPAYCDLEYSRGLKKNPKTNVFQNTWSKRDPIVLVLSRNQGINKELYDLALYHLLSHELTAIYDPLHEQIFFLRKRNEQEQQEYFKNCNQPEKRIKDIEKQRQEELQEEFHQQSNESMEEDSQLGDELEKLCRLQPIHQLPIFEFRDLQTKQVVFFPINPVYKLIREVTDADPRLLDKYL